VKCKLLVAEDELIERKVLCRTLQKYLGDLICLYEAKNGREALEIFAREAPQVAVLDIEMPGLTGLEVARKIRETDKNCAILFLTGFDKFDYARQAISVRAMDYLLKPYNEQELIFAVEDAIRQVSVQLPARHSPLRLQSPSAGKRMRICAPPSSGQRSAASSTLTMGRISPCRMPPLRCATRTLTSASCSSSALR
jgi:CheY-like chemotaxis protein